MSGSTIVVLVVVVVVGTVVVVVPLGGATVVVVVVVVVVWSSIGAGGRRLGGAGTVVVGVESSGLASAIEPGRRISATTARAAARGRFERDTMLTTSRRTSEIPGYTARLHRQVLTQP